LEFPEKFAEAPRLTAQFGFARFAKTWLRLQS